MISLNKEEALFALEVIGSYIEENRLFLEEMGDNRPLTLLESILAQLNTEENNEELNG